VEVLLELAANRAGVTAVAARRALGVVVSSNSLNDTSASDAEKAKNAYALVGRSLLQAGASDFRTLTALLEAELKTIVADLTDEDRARAAKPFKNGYDEGVTDGTFTLLGGLAAAALSRVPQTVAAVAPLLLPALIDSPEPPNAPSKAAPPPAKKGFGSAAVASQAPRGPDYGSLIRKQSRFEFPELSGWSARPDAAGAGDLLTSQSALAVVLDLLLQLPPSQRAHAVFPGGRFLAQSLSLGCERFTENVTLSGAEELLPADVLADPSALLVIVEFSADGVEALLRGPRSCRLLLLPVARLPRAAEATRAEVEKAAIALHLARLLAAAN
jgi:hypothetical protein